MKLARPSYLGRKAKSCRLTGGRLPRSPLILTQYNDMENKETINQTSFLEKISASIRPILKECNKYKDDEKRHCAMIVLASDLNDNGSIGMINKSYAHIMDVLMLLDYFISSQSVYYQKIILNGLKKLYDSRQAEWVQNSNNN